MKVYGKLVIAPKLERQSTCVASLHVFLLSSPLCGLARGHVFMADLYIPRPVSNSRSAVHLQGTRTPGGHQEMSISRSCCFSQTETKPHTGSESAPGPRDSCGHRQRSDLRPESEGWDFRIGVVLVTWTSLQSLPSHLSTKHFHQMTRGVPSQVPLQTLEATPRPFWHVTPSITLVHGNTSPCFLPKLS